MAPRKLTRILIAGIFLAFSGTSWGLTIDNPNPGVYGNDVDGAGIFVPGDFLFNFEFFDGLGSDFGFYYDGDPNVLFPIFEASDQAPPLQNATVNFNTGIIRDGDTGEVQNSALSQLAIQANGTDPIGFYLELNTGSVVYGQDIIYSDADLNPGGAFLANQVAEFPTLSPDLSFLIVFADINLITGAQNTLGAYLVSPLTPVPVPGALGLWILGISGIALFRRKLRAGQ